MWLFVFVIVYADKFYSWSETVYVSSVFMETDDEDTATINLDSLTVEINDQNEWVINYVVQAGDSLGKIARNFGTTISHIRKVNGLSSNDSIRPNQKLLITDEDEWIIYTIPEKTNVLVFANKYTLNVEDIMTLNYIQDESETLQQGQEVFLNVSLEKAYDLWLMERPKPVFKPESNLTYKPTINKPVRVWWGSVNDDGTYTSNSKIISKRTFKKTINNKFYAGNCTWYVAAITPQIFPYTDDNTQARPFWWNGNEWYDNAKKAWFSVGQKAVAWSIAVYKKWWRNVSAWHVAKVISVNADEGTMVVEDMNYAGKFIVTRRTESLKNSNLKWYIYMPKTPWKPN